MPKKIMFIGAGPYQKQGIEKAKHMGLFVIATDGNASAPGLKLADISRVIDVKNAEENLKLAQKYAIDGILTVSSDVSIKTVAAISDRLSLPGIGVEVAEKSTDKELMRKAFRDSGIPSPKSYAVHSCDELLRRVDNVGFPAVIKPADSAGSRGVKLLKENDDIEEAYKRTLSYSLEKKVLIEEFMEGLEVSVEAFVDDGETHIIALSDKVRTEPPYLLDLEVIFPTAYKDSTRSRIIELAKKMIKAVGIRMGPVHIEIMITRNGPMPVELAARGPGFKVFTDILPCITGIDILRETIRCSLGEKPNFRHNSDLAAVLKFLEAKPGTVKKIRNLEEARQIRGIYEAEVYKQIGEIVNPLTCGSDRVGHVITFDKSRERAVETARKAAALIEIVTG